jgi:TonB family protein
MLLRREPLPRFQVALLASLAFHVGLWQVLSWRGKEALHDIPSVEIDLTRPFRLTTNPLQQRRVEKPGFPNPILESPKVLAPIPSQPRDVSPPAKEWTLPQPGQPVESQITTDKPGTAVDGYIGPKGEGEVDVIYLTELPRILNMEELGRYLQKFYPESERRAGREGYVLLDVHLDSSGRVGAVEVAQSAGAAFDEAARKVIREARFSPAKVREKSVAVKIRKPIVFQLQD